MTIEQTLKKATIRQLTQELMSRLPEECPEDFPENDRDALSEFTEFFEDVIDAWGLS